MKTITEFKDKLTGAASSLGEGAVGVAKDFQSHAKDAWGSLQDQTKRAVRKSSTYIRKHPVPTALAASGVGLALGLTLRRRAPVSFRDRYIVKPLHQSGGLLLGLLLGCGALLKRHFSPASNGAEAFAGNGGEQSRNPLKPAKRAGRKTRRKLGS